jgi:folate-binding protein YgfZ
MILGLTKRAVFEISGTDRIDYLQGLATNDIKKDSPLIYTCFLNSKGRFLFEAFVYKTDKAVFFDVPNLSVEIVNKFLKFYKIGKKVEIQQRLDLFVNWSQGVFEGGFCDPRNPVLGFRTISANTHIKGDEEYLRIRVENCIADGDDLECERSVILEYGFEALNAISFSKGCYIGQELMARTKHIGEIRKSVYKLYSAEKID